MACGTAKGRRVYGGTFLAVPCICTPRCRWAEAEVRARWRRRRVCARRETRATDGDNDGAGPAAIRGGFWAAGNGRDFNGFLGIFRDAGLGAATVQRLEVTHEQISTLF